MADYATVEDIIALKRPLTADEQARATAMIPVACDRLRDAAKRVGKDLDAMITNGDVNANTVKGVTVDIIMRELNTAPSQLPATQYSESAGSISQSFTLPNASGSLNPWPSDLKALGLKRQQIGILNLIKENPSCSLHS